LNMSEIHEKSSWGGKRPGAGRPKDPYSLRALAERARVTVSSLKTVDFIKCVAPELGPAVRDGQISLRQARARASEKLLSEYPRLLESVQQRRIPRRYAERAALGRRAMSAIAPPEG
jgi:hypothetical protein